MRSSDPTLGSFLRKVLVTVGIVALAGVVLLFLWESVQLLLVIFAGALLGVLLDGIARWVSHRTPLSRHVALVITATLLLAVFVTVGALAGPKIVEQAGTMASHLPQSIERLRSELEASELGRQLLAAFQSSSGTGEGSGGWGVLQRAGSALLVGAVHAVAIAFIGFYMGYSPSLYVGSVVALVPPARRERARCVFEMLGYALRSWLKGRIASMAVVGVLTGLGLWAVGMPLALMLGLIAGLLSFIPYLGPALAFVPGVILASGQGPTMVLWVVAVYFAVQIVESYLVTPLIELEVVSVPPAVTVGAELIMGTLAGGLGVLLATPMVVVVMVLVQMLYLEDALGDEVHVAGR